MKSTKNDNTQLTENVSLSVKARLAEAAKDIIGTYMSCHWAEKAIFGLSIVIVIQDIMLTVSRDASAKCALSLSLIGSAVVTLLIPGTFIRLCVYPDMQCRAVTQPFQK